MREGILKPNTLRSGSCVWFRDASRREQTASIGYEVNTRDTPPWVRLLYAVTGTTDSFDYRIRLAITRPRFGGLRWWFICPLVANGRPCERRVGKLYLPAGGRYFGCRHCHNLTYRSVQEHDKRVDTLRRQGPAALWALLYDPNASLSQLLLVAKALF